MIYSENFAQEWMNHLPLVDKGAVKRFELLANLLKEENQKQNLISAISLNQLWQRHLLDSAQLLRFTPNEINGPWLDLGTGSGFPGVVIACLLPDIEVLLVESRARRITWLDQIVRQLDLPKVKILGSRLELVKSFHASVISARAFAPLDQLLALASRFSTNDTLWLLPKGRSARDELDRLSGKRHMFHVEQSLSEPDAGIITGNLL